MKYITLALALGTFVAAQAQNCVNPVSTGTFQAAFNQIAVQQISQNKLNKAVEFVNANCLLASQVKNIAQLFTEESYRLEFCKAAYTHTYDRVNFYEVYDAFTTYSNVLRLHDFVHGGLPAEQPAVVQTPVVVAPVVAAPKTVTFPKYNYPASGGYSGNKGCDGPVLDPVAFNEVAVDLSSQPTDESRQVAIQRAANEQCLDMAQVMKLTSMIKSETVRMNTLTNVFGSIYDQDNYQAAASLFTTVPGKNLWTKYAAEQLQPPAPPVCDVSDADFKSALNAVKAKHFSDDRIALVQVLAKDKCFNVSQIRGISQLAPFGEEKITMFKTLYAKCPDKDNYYKLVDELKFSHEQQEMNDFIKKN